MVPEGACLHVVCYCLGAVVVALRVCVWVSLLFVWCLSQLFACE